MCGTRGVRSMVTSLIAVLVLGAAPAHPWDGFRGVTAIALDPQRPSTIYAGTFDRGLFKSTDAGATWSATALTNSPVEALAVDPLAPATVYAAAADGGVFKSTDGGATWSSTGLATGSVRILVVDPSTPSTLYAAIPDVAVFKSTDGGATWNTSLSFEWYPNPAIQGLVIDPTSPSTVYAAITHWREYTAGEVLASNAGSLLLVDWIGAVAIDPQSPNKLYATDGDMFYASLDGGWHWSSHSTSLGLNPANLPSLALAVDPLVPTTFYMWSLYAGLFKSTDQGVTWVDSGVPTAAALAIDPVSSTTLYVGTGVGLLKSQDGGAHWTGTGLGQQSPLSYLSMDPIYVPGGTASTGTVTLMTAAPEGGVTVALSSDNAAAVSVPASVTVPAGATSARFTVFAQPATSYATVTIAATSADAIRYAAVVVTPAR